MGLLTELNVAPSILSADFSRLGAQVGEVLAAGARVIHVDVMDGHFVPPITFGPIAVGAIADRVHDAGGIIDVHLMIERPERQVQELARAGADSITVHVEATPHVHYALAAIRDAGCTASAAICPATPVDSLAEVAGDALDMALCMSVNPGWGAQEFIPASLSKLQRMRAALPDRVGLEVDGGIHDGTVGPCARAGANVLVAGSAVFSADDPGGAFEALAAAARAGREA
jgi:ribulose-phosphate 3-epimerase